MDSHFLSILELNGFSFYKWILIIYKNVIKMDSHNYNGKSFL